MKNKTAEQFCQAYSLVDEYGGADLSSVEAMKEYAQSVAEDLRERIASEACLEPNGMLLQVSKDSIRNV